jgi:hypothetical protein
MSSPPVSRLPRATFVVHANLEGRARLVFSSPNGDVPVQLEPRLARLLYVLIKAWESDSEFDDEDRGLRTRTAIARALAKLPNAGPQIEETSITQYVFSISRSIRKAVPSPDQYVESPTLIRNKKKIGYGLMPPGVKLVEIGVSDVHAGWLPV